MSEDNTNENPSLPDELTTLKARAKLMGINHHPSIGVDALREKINAALAEPEAKVSPTGEAPTNGLTTSQLALAEHKAHKDNAAKLIRCRITCMNPNKKEWEGEIFTVGNSVVGTHKKYIAFNVDFHIPQIIFNQISDRQCQIFQTVKDPATGRKSRKGKMIKEFGIEILPDLTEKDLADLARRQAMSAGAVTA